MRQRGSRGDDAGFTLIELVISVLILGIIIAPLASSFVLNITTSAEAQQRISNSADAQQFTSYFSDDIASSERIDTSASGCGGVSPLLEIQRADGSLVDYTVAVNSDAQTELNVTPVYQVSRATCATAGGAVTNSQQMAASLRSQPTLKCDEASCAAGTSKPLLVTLTVDEIGRPVTDTTQDYIFTVTGTRRVTE